MEYHFLIFGIWLVVSEVATGDTGKLTVDGNSSTHWGDLGCFFGGEEHVERQGDLLQLWKKLKEKLCLLEKKQSLIK